MAMDLVHPGFTSSTMITAVVFVVAVVLYAIHIIRQQKANNFEAKFPPGPPGLPLVGNLFGIGREGWLEKQAAIYGEMFTIRMGSFRVIYLSRKTLKEALLNGHFLSERTPTPAMWDYFKDRGLVGASYHCNWKEQRGFVLRAMQMFGVGQTCSQENIIQETEHLLKELQNTGGKAFDPSTLFQLATVNVISYFAYGHRSAYDDKVIVHLVENMRKCIQSLKYGCLSMFFPFLNKIPFLVGCQFFKYFDILREHQREEIAQHKCTIDRSKPRDYIDHYLMEIESSKVAEGNGFTEENLEFHLVDLFMAGSESSSAIMYWCVLMLVLHPDIQIKVQQELDTTISKAQAFVKLEDQSRCPYLQAVIHEALRFGTVAPVAMRNSTVDAELNNYRFPKGTTFMVNYLGVHLDPQQWDDPQEFKPERFLSKQQPPTLVKQNYIMAFSTGRRHCLGERLARAELFIFLANIFRKFNIRIPHGSPLPSTKPTIGFTRTPKPFKVCFTQRLQETHVDTDGVNGQ